MPRTLLPSPSESRSSFGSVSSSRKSEKKVASVHDADFRDSLRYRNVYINARRPSTELLRRAKSITMRPRTSPEIDAATAQELRDVSRKLETEGEEVIVQEMMPYLIPSTQRASRQGLARNANQVWANAVPVPLDSDVLADPLPLPRPKPDLTFGYSQAAFNRKQLTTIDLLLDQAGRSYALPDKKLRFPFLAVEFKSQAKMGTHFTAMNQAANAGSIATNGVLELMRRSPDEEHLTSDEPQFFSLSMDHASACVNVHWLCADAEEGRFSFHVEGLSKHFLDDEDGIRAVRRAVRNIMDYGAEERLKTLCRALDAYRQNVVVEKGMPNADNHRESAVQAQPEESQSGTTTRPALSRGQSGHCRAEPQVADATGEGWAERLRSGRPLRRKQAPARTIRHPRRSGRQGHQAKLSDNPVSTPSRPADQAIHRETQDRRRTARDEA